MTFTEDSLLYYVNGVLQPAPAITPAPLLVITGITVPANGNVTFVYQTKANEFAPLVSGSTITNTVTVTGGGLITPSTATEVVTVIDAPELTISKSLSPTVVAENGQITYTFVIRNSGSIAVVATDNAIITDDFDPILNITNVTFNGTPWTLNTNYTYQSTTGEFATTAGQITVPAATITQNPVTGVWTVAPGFSTLVVTGTI